LERAGETVRGVSAVWLFGFVAMAGCTSDDAPQDIDVAATFTVSSTAFAPSGPIPRKYTCDDANVSPALAFRGMPGGARTLAMIMDDPDAPRGTFVHWVFWNLPSTAINLAEGADVGAMGAVGGANGADTTTYLGPCPPSGTHRYFFKVYALDGNLDLEAGSNKAELRVAMDGRVLARGELMGTYARS
jgi:hypothetical protein